MRHQPSKKGDFCLADIDKSTLSNIFNCSIMDYFFDPIVVLHILKNLEMAPNNAGTVGTAFKNRPDIPEEIQESYLNFLEEKELIESDDDRFTITPKGRIVLRQAEIIVLSTDNVD